MERLFRRGLEIEPASVRSVLVLEYMLPLGCCVHLTPLYEAIKRGRPDVVVTVATFGLAASLLRHHPYVDHLIETPNVLVDTMGAIRYLTRELKRLSIKPDCVLTGASDKRTRIALLGVMTGAPRGGYTLCPKVYQHPLEYDKTRSLIDNNLRLAGLVGCGTEHQEPAVFVSAKDVAVASGLRTEVSPAGKPLLVMVTQTSGGQSTGWHDERFAAVARFACEELGFAVAYVGTVTDVLAVEALRELAGVGTSVAGRTSVTELAALLAMSDFVVSLDTGTMHVGRAMGVPMVVLGPSWQRPIEWMPLGLPQVRILRGPDREDVPTGYRLDEVEAADVIGAVRELMGAYPPSADGRRRRVARWLSAVDHSNATAG